MTDPNRTPTRPRPRLLPLPAPQRPCPIPPLHVTIADVRAARYCLAGVRPWFRRHGLDWQDFLARGIDAAILRATGDALIDPVIRAAETRAQAEQEPPDGRA